MSYKSSRNARYLKPHEIIRCLLMFLILYTLVLYSQSYSISNQRLPEVINTSNVKSITEESVPDVYSITIYKGYRYITLAWQIPTTMGSYAWAGTREIRSLSDDSIGYAQGTVIYSGTANSYTDYDVSHDTVYYYLVQTYALNSVYNPDSSYTIYTVYSQGTTIGARSQYESDVAHFNYSLKYPYVNLSWSNPTDAFYTSTVIVRKGNSLPQNPSDGNVIYMGTGTYCQDSGLDINTTYYYRAYALVSPTDYSVGTSIMHIRTRNDVQKISILRGFGNGSNLCVKNRYLYVSDSTIGIHIFDVHDPYHPEYLSYCTSTNFIYNITVEGKYAYLSECTSGVEIINIENPYHPYRVGYIPSNDNAYNVAVHGDYAYIAMCDSGYRIYDIRDPATPVLVSVDTETGYYSTMFYKGHYFYGGFNARVKILDMADPYNPTMRKIYDLRNHSCPGNFYIHNNFLYYPKTYYVSDYYSTRPYTVSYMNIATISKDTIFSDKGAIIIAIGLDWGFYYLDVTANERYAFTPGHGDNVFWLIDNTQYYAPFIQDMGADTFSSVEAKGNIVFGATRGFIGALRYTSFKDTNYIDIDEGPESNSNPTNARNTVTCFVNPSDNWGYDRFSYQWSANEGVLSNTTTDSPTWIAPVNSSCTVQYYQLSVTVNNLHGITTTVSYMQGVRPHLENVHIFNAAPLDGGVKLTWRNPVSKNYTGTRIRRKGGGYPTGPTDGVQVYWYNGEMCNDVGLVNGKTYYYAAFSHDSVLKFTTGAYASVYIPWNNSEGTFTLSSSTSRWALEKLSGSSTQPTNTWLDGYGSHSGILCLGFSNQTEGIKITAKSRFTPNPINSWYRLRMNYYAEGTTSGMEIKSSVLLYSNHSNYAVREVAGNWTGNGLVQPGTWYTYDMYSYCRSSSAQVQVVIKNNGSKGKLYIDTLSIDMFIPPALTNGTTMPVEMGDFDTGEDTTSWAFETPPGEPWTILPTCSWLSTFSTQTGVMSLTFDKATEGVKLTSIPTYVLPQGKNAIMTFKLYSEMSVPSGLQVIGYLYGERTVAIFQVDLGAKGELGVLPGNTWNTVYVPLTSVSGNTVFRLQLLFKNSLQYPETIYIDDVQLQYEKSAALLQWVELMEPAEESKWLVTALLP